MRENIGRFIRRAVIFDERLPDFFRTRANQFDLALEEKAQAVNRVDIKRVAHRDDQSARAVADGDDLESARIFGANLVDHVRRHDFGRQIDPIHVRLRGETARDFDVRNDPVLDQQIDDVAAAVEARPGRLDLRTADEASVLEKF